MNKLRLPLPQARLHVRAATALAGVLLAVAVALVVFLSRTPYGYFDLTTMMPGHDSEDTVVFSKGAVTMKSCCGDMYFGAVARAPDGVWVWRYQFGEKDSLPPMGFRVQPGLLGLKVISTNPAGTYVLKRKFGSPRPHAVAGQ